ncbi:MAG: FAD-binding oxidoreductase [Candidatus Aerophobetes bacterium]|nr:FAD-binding oxidoreductase [Candidatus Aerophobetes bacterium]
MKRSAEVVIIGGGISGLSTAYNLARMGCRDVVLLEKDSLYSGSSGRCAAGVRQQFGLEMNCRLSKGSIEILENLNELLDYDRDIELKQGGYLWLLHTDEEVEIYKKNVQLQNSLGIESRLITVEEALKIVPYLNPERIKACTFHQKDGHVNPFEVSQAYAEAAKRLGVEINIFTKVTNIKVKNNRIVEVLTDKGKISTSKVFNAAGAFAKDIGRMVGVDLPLRPERRQILATEPVEPLLAPMVISTELSCQQEPQGSILMACHGPNDPEGTDVSSTWEFMEEMAKRICKILPVLSNIKVVRQWAGSYTMTVDAAPILGSVPELEGFYLAAGFSGHGFMLGPMTGVLMAECILGKEMTIPIDKLDIGRFERGELMREPAVS